ncbi:MAG: 50S ribosomal protein L25/general stress protein Ctc [Alphaproteobacteria bacterium]|nr:50S ribosomal protein L25/general stress protein Ctc [Alphaproteobacteria bacterium]
MGTTITINASPRTLAGTGGARAVRTSGMVPGIVYGNKKDPEMIALEPRSLMAECMQPGFFSKLYSLSINGAQQEVLAKHVQFHPVTDRPLHVDFMRVSKGAKVHVFVPITFINEDKAPGIKRGGVLNIIHHNLELICPAQSIPEKLVVDLTGREINQTIHLEALALPEGVIAAHPDRDNTIATIVAPTVEEEKPAGAEGTEATPEAGATPASGGGSTPPAAS